MKNLFILNFIFHLFAFLNFSFLLGSSKPLVKMFRRGGPQTEPRSLPPQCPLHITLNWPWILLVLLSLSSYIFILPTRTSQETLSDVFLKSRHILSVAFPLPTSLPTLSKKEMRLVGHILFLSEPTFSESIFICTNRHNGMLISENGKSL